MKKWFLFLMIFALILPYSAVANVLSDDWEDASIEELRNAISLIEARVNELESSSVSDLSKDNELASANINESSFIDDLAAGLVERWSDVRDTSTMSDKQIADYFTTCVMYELNRIEPYSKIEFNDPVLGDYAHTYISALQSQLIGITEYFGKDDVLYNEYWNDGYNKRAQMIYWINRKYGIDVPNNVSNNLKEMIESGKFCDIAWSIQETLTKQLQAIDCPFTKSKSNRLELDAFTLTNDSSYPITRLSLNIDFLDKNNNVIDSTYLISSSDVPVKKSIQTRKQTIYQDSFDSFQFSISFNISTDYYYDQLKFSVIPNIQYSWDKSTIKRNGEIASGQFILQIQDITASWDYYKSWTKTLYVPQIKFSIRNIGSSSAETITVHCVFTNKSTNEVWDEETVYVISSSDSPLKPAFSKKVFVYSSVGYEKKPNKLPDLSAEIYVNDVLLATIDSISK